MVRKYNTLREVDYPPRIVGSPLRDSRMTLLHSGDLHTALLRGISKIASPFGLAMTFRKGNPPRIVGSPLRDSRMTLLHSEDLHTALLRGISKIASPFGLAMTLRKGNPLRDSSMTLLHSKDLRSSSWKSFETP